MRVLDARFARAGLLRFARNGGVRSHYSHFVIRSISAISSGVSVQPTALTFCSTCSGFVAPAITLDTCGRAASQENASSSMRVAALAGEGLQLLDDVQLRLGQVAVAQARALGEARAGGRGAPRLYLPVSRPLASGKNGSRPSP